MENCGRCGYRGETAEHDCVSVLRSRIDREGNGAAMKAIKEVRDLLDTRLREAWRQVDGLDKRLKALELRIDTQNGKISAIMGRRGG